MTYTKLSTEVHLSQYHSPSYSCTALVQALVCVFDKNIFINIPIGSYDNQNAVVTANLDFI